MARKFLYFIAMIIVIVVGARIAWEIWSDDLAAIALVPSGEFVEQDPLAENAYQDPELWYSRPGIGVSDPARWQPAIADPLSDAAPAPEASALAAEDTAEEETQNEPAAAPQKQAEVEAETVPDFAVFFAHPTSFIDRSNWNARFGNADAEGLARTYVRSMASPFNSASEIWAPRYRQATMGAFLTNSSEAQKALDAAYADVLDAYRFFISSVDEDTPIVLVGHSQGALHLTRLMREEIADNPIAQRVVAVYAIGWPISVEHDLPSLGLAACATPQQTGCILSWSSFAEPADPSDVIDAYANSVGFDGNIRGDSQILCTNPLTGTFSGAAAMDKNLGTLVPNDDMSNGELVPEAVPARCDQRGLLLIGDPPELGRYVLPGNNYHVYDIPLFWANTKADVNRRVQSWSAQSSSAN